VAGRRLEARLAGVRAPLGQAVLAAAPLRAAALGWFTASGQDAPGVHGTGAGRHGPVPPLRASGEEGWRPRRGGVPRLPRPALLYPPKGSPASWRRAIRGPPATAGRRGSASWRRWARRPTMPLPLLS